MNNFENGKKYTGDALVDNIIWQRTSRLAFRTMAGISASLGTINYFIAPDERLQHTVIPYVGAVAMLCVDRVLDTFANKIQNDAIELAIKHFNDEPQ